MFERFTLYRKKQKISFILSLFFILIVILLLLYTANIFVIKEGLKGFLTPNLNKEDNNQLYSLQLKRFWVATEYDPILALPGVDLDLLTQTIQHLQDSRYEYLHFYSEMDQTKILDYLFPIDFLQSLSELEKSRRTFIELPTYESAIAYNNMLIHTLYLGNIYTDSSAKIYSQFRKDEEGVFSIAFPTGITSNFFIGETLKEISKQFELNIKKEKTRLSCLKNIFFSPRVCMITMPSIVTYNKNEHTLERDTLTNRGNMLKKYTQGVKNKDFSITNTQSNDLPLVYIDNSKCIRNGYGTYLFTWKKSRTSKIPFLYVTPVDELLFHDLAINPHGFNLSLYNTGGKYTFQPMNPYMCIDSTLDAGKIRSAYYLQTILTNNPIASLYSINKNNKLLHSLIKAEQKLISQKDIIEISTVKSYIKEAQKLIYTKVDNGLLSKNQKLRLLTLITAWRAQSSWLSYEIGRVDDMSTTNMYILNQSHIPIEALFISRGYPSILLLANNTTLYSHKSISFLERKEIAPLKRFGLIDYDSTLSSFISLPDLPDFMIQEESYFSEIYSR